ncbi:MAG TPA: 8-oxoguanine deaminase [Anaerolineae bacterium]|nr:8-oxoguanine deaminase [Anaerolineae bacterium]HQH38259.1 8-oxoguanine deaminase [Anaerolineae bacterium]
MSTLLLKNATLLVTMDDQRRRIPQGSLFVRDHVIEAVGTTSALDHYHADHTIDATDMVILPGLINTHHHLYQTLTRAVPAAQDAVLFNWLKTLYPLWAGLTGEAIYISALTGLAELMLSGCTTASDHLYIFPNDARLDDEIRAAQEIGIRFHATRGAMSRGESQGGLPPDRVVEDEAFILKDTQRVIETYHDAQPYAMLRIAVAPCSPFSVTENLMRESARLARAYGVRLHTHLAETADEEAFCLATSGKRPVAYAASLDWLGDDVWFAHGVHINAAEIHEMAHTHTGVAHCPSSNMRLASGIAPVRAYLDAGVPVGLGVDGSASNDSSHMLAEARMALLLQRVSGNPAGLSAEEALWIATRGGAAVLGRDDIGQLAPGKAADFIGLRLDTLAYAGAAVHDPLAATVFCHPQNVALSVINGRVVIQEGQLLTLDWIPTLERHNAIARQLVRTYTNSRL